MAYSDFAYWYDQLNGIANYDLLARWLLDTLAGYGIRDGILADLGCGTGEVSLRLAKAGYDMIAVDHSYDMLAVFREKMAETGAQDILLLQQDIAELDLYGTIRGAVSTFDTFNHLPPERLTRALKRAALFMEPGGLLLFDANTPFKHEHILADNEFRIEDDDGIVCIWNNHFDAHQGGTAISVMARQNGKELFNENFVEYSYDLAFWRESLQNAGFSVLHVQDGERFAPLERDSQRFLFTAQKQ